MNKARKTWITVGIAAASVCIISGLLHSIEAIAATAIFVPLLPAIFFRTNNKQNVVIAVVIVVSLLLAVSTHHSSSTLITVGPMGGPILLGEQKYWNAFLFVEFVLFFLMFIFLFCLKGKKKSK